MGRPVWIISPYENTDYDFCEMPAGSPSDHMKALSYARKRLEDAWDDCEFGDKIEVTMELKLVDDQCKGV